MLVLLRIVISVFLLCVAAFCAFGFLATDEPPGSMRWRIGYGIAIAVCFTGIVCVNLAKPMRR